MTSAPTPTPRKLRTASELLKSLADSIPQGEHPNPYNEWINVRLDFVRDAIRLLGEQANADLLSSPLDSAEEKLLQRLLGTQALSLRDFILEGSECDSLRSSRPALFKALSDGMSLYGGSPLDAVDAVIYRCFASHNLLKARVLETWVNRPRGQRGRASPEDT